MAEYFESTGRGYSGLDGKAENSMAFLSLIIAAQLNLFGSVALGWKYVSPCMLSSERFLMDHFERTAALPKKSGKCKREEQIRKVVNAAVESLESTWVKQWD